MTDVIPESYDFATDRNAAKIKDDRVTQYFISSDLFGCGIETTDYKGYKLKIYSKERMLIELLRYKSKLPFDYYKEVIINYRKLVSKLDIQEIKDETLSNKWLKNIESICTTRKGDNVMNVFNSIMTGLQEALDYEEGKVSTRTTKISVEPLPEITAVDTKKIPTQFSRLDAK